jgi:glycine/D-amino acid oxidase-like deaminating enzyme
MGVAIVGGGFCGLSLALQLKQRGIAARTQERTPEIKPLGLGNSGVARFIIRQRPVARTGR